MGEARLIFNSLGSNIEKGEGFNWLLTRYSWKMESSINNWFCRQIEKWKVPSIPDYYNPCRQLEKWKVPSTPEGHFCASSCALCRSHGVLHRTIHPQGEKIIVHPQGEQIIVEKNRWEILVLFWKSLEICVKVSNLQGFEKERWEIKGWADLSSIPSSWSSPSS